MLETCCDILVDAYKRNWITSRDGNISIRHHDRDHFYITPSGVRKQNMQPEMFKKIAIWKTINSGVGSAALNYSWTVIEQTDLSGNLQPSGEMPLHFGLQKKKLCPMCSEWCTDRAVTVMPQTGSLRSASALGCAIAVPWPVC